MCFSLSLQGPFSAQQHTLLQNEFGEVVTNTASLYARRLPWPLTKADKIGCLSIAQKYLEDEPISRHDLFPGISHQALQQMEWRVLHKLEFNLRT